jgi:pyruvate dehydrogenase E1 component alpha subunit
MDKKIAKKYLFDMLKIRQFEEACGRMYMQGKIKGFLHLYIGEEAIAVGSISELSQDDYIITHYRDHGHALARGMDPNKAMAELYGKVDGTSRGKGGSMHLFDSNLNFMGGHAIVGGHMPIAVGIALGIKKQKRKGLVMCFFGDGAVNEGEFHESMNLAALWELPIIFYLENNQYGMGTHVKRSSANPEMLYKFADLYNMPSTKIDGMDVLTVRDSAREAIDKIRNERGPILIEAMTYRFRGHSMADPSAYRENEEVQQWQKEKDPIELFKQHCYTNNVLTKEEVESINEEVKAVIKECLDFAENSPFPDMSVAADKIYNIN